MGDQSIHPRTLTTATTTGERATAESEPVTEASRSTDTATTWSDCPECGGRLTTDERHADRSCEECGLVVDSEQIDHGPEWRQFDTEVDAQKSRVGAPVTERYHDKGLSTKIGWKNEDAQGRTLDSAQRAKMSRLRTWDERFRQKDSQERNLKQALGEIDRMGSALGMPTPTREVASRLYRTAVSEGLLPGRCIEGIASASLYTAGRQVGTPRSLDEVSTVSRVERIRVQRAYRYLQRELELGVEPADPMAYLQRFHSELGFDGEVEYVARSLIEAATEQNLHSGKSPLSLAAGALYAAARLTNTDTTQAAVSEATDVSKVTIRNRYQELVDVA